MISAPAGAPVKRTGRSIRTSFRSTAVSLPERASMAGDVAGSYPSSLARTR